MKKYDRILLDIDNTITKLQPTLDLMAEVFNKNTVSENDIHNFQLSKVFNSSNEDEKNFWLEYEEYLTIHSELAKQRTMQIFKDYTHRNTKIDVVTMRPENVCKTTKQWLINNNIPFNSLSCIGKAGLGISKIEIAKDLGSQAIFEDNPVMFEEIDRRNLNNRFDLFIVDYPYNQHIDNAHRLCRDSGLII